MTGTEPDKQRRTGSVHKQESRGSIFGKIRKPSMGHGLKKKLPSVEDPGELPDICQQCRSVPLPAHKAAYLGHIPCLRALHRDAPGKMRAVDRNGATPLHLAVRQMNVDTVFWLLQNCVELIRAKAHGGETPLLIAAAQGSKDCLEMLTESEPQHSLRHDMVMDTDSQGLSSIHLATLKQREDCVAWLIKHFGHRLVLTQTQSGITPVHIAAATGFIGILKLLIKKNKKGASFVDAFGTTPAYFAAQEGQLEPLQYLIESCKVDPLARCDDGMTSMHAAAQGGHLPLVQWLVELVGGEVVTIRTRDHATPIHFAAAMGHHDTLKWMLSQPKAEGAVNMADADMGTPAHDAADNGHVECLRILKENGAHLTAKDKDGATPLSLALQSENPECRRWAEEEQALLDADGPKSPSRTEANAILAEELTRLAMEAQKSNTLPVEKSVRAGSPHPRGRFRQISSERQTGQDSSDHYAVPSRLVKKRWDGGGAVPDSTPKRLGQNIEDTSTEESGADEIENLSKVSERQLSTKHQTVSASSMEAPDIPQRTKASEELELQESPSRMSSGGADKQEKVEPTSAIDETDGQAGNAVGRSPQSPGSDNSVQPGNIGLCSSPSKKRPHSAGPQPTHQEEKDGTRTPHSAPSSPIQGRAVSGQASQSGTPTLSRAQYPRLHVGLFDSPTKSTNSSPAGSPMSSPLVVRRPFHLAAKPPGSPTLPRSQSLPRRTTRAEEPIRDMKKAHSFGSADTEKIPFDKPAQMAKLLRDKDEENALGEASP